MFILSNFIAAIAVVLNIALTALMWIIIIRALLSWVSPDPHNPLVQALYGFTDLFLRPIRARLPAALRYGPVDISPFIAVLAILLLERFLIVSLLELAYRIKAL